MSVACSFLAYAYVDEIKLMHKFNLAMQSDAPWFISVFTPSVRVTRYWMFFKLGIVFFYNCFFLASNASSKAEILFAKPYILANGYF